MEFKNKKSHELLKGHFLKLKKENPKFSVRALSQKLKISHSFLVAIFNGKKMVPADRLADLCQTLKMDDHDTNLLKKRIVLERNSDIDAQFFSTTGLSPTDVEQLPTKHLSILRQWWNLPILELIACSGEQGITEAWIIKKIPTSEKEIKISLNNLCQMGLISSKDGKYVKTSLHLKIGTQGANEITRHFYKTTLELAKEKLNETDQEAFDNRLITAMSCSVNPQQIPKAKIRLMEAMNEIRDILTEGECSEVFFLQAQLFGVLNK